MPKSSLDRPPFCCACVQFNVKRGDVDYNRKLALAGIHAAAEAGAQLIVLPEMWPTSFVSELSDELLDAAREAEDAVTELSGRYGMVIVGGGPERDGGLVYNRALVIDGGTVLGSYRKIHLFTPNAEHRVMAAGSQPLIVDTSLGRIGVLICYDIRFPELVRYYFRQKVELLAVPSQWPEARSAHWRTLLRARAIENEMYVAGCNRTGIETSLRNDESLHFPGDSRIVDPMGETIGAGAGEEGPVLAEIEMRRVRTMRRILPIHKDRRPDVYNAIWKRSWD